MSKAVHWPYIIIAFLALLAFGLLDNARGPFFPDIIKDLNLRDDQAAWFFAYTSLIAFFGSYLAPKIQDKIGALNGLRGGLFLITFGFYGMSWAGSLGTLLLACTVFGFGFGVTQVFEHICIQEGASSQLRRRLFNGLHSFYALAALLAPLSAGLLLNWDWTWREGFRLFSVLPVIIFLYSMTVKKLPSSEDKTRVIKAKGLELRHMLYVAVIQSLYVTAELSIGTRLVLYVQRTVDVSPAESTLYLTAFFALLLVGRILSTLFEFRKLSTKQILLLAIALSAISYVLGLLYSPWLISLCGLFMAPVFAVSMEYIAHVFKEKSAHGISMTFSVGAVFIVSMHYFVGLITEHYGIAWGLSLGPLFLLIAFVLFIFESKFFPQTIKNI